MTAPTQQQRDQYAQMRRERGLPALGDIPRQDAEDLDDCEFERDEEQDAQDEAAAWLRSQQL